MRARAVIGASFGDEGKGLVTDYLCRVEGAGMVVRFNGGAQAGHTVVTPTGQRHVFGHFGAGAFCGVPTFLSQFVTLNPILFFKELDKLRALNVTPVVYAHPNCLVTTFADMVINQRLEDARGGARHGSVGVGFNETYERSQVPGLRITMSDLWNGADIRGRLRDICGKYAAFRTGSAIDDAEPMIESFAKGCQAFADVVNPLGIHQCLDPVFEGAQGLLLDQDNKEFFPNVTRSHTGIHNVRILCHQAGIADIGPYYVSRTYLTRHGAGLLPGEDAFLHYEDNTNIPHAYQGSIRFAPLDAAKLIERCAADANGQYKIALTHCDQSPPAFTSALRSFGPSAVDIEATQVG